MSVCVIAVSKSQELLLKVRRLFIFTFGYLPSIFRLSVSSVCRLSVTFMHGTQLTEIFRNVSTPFCTLACHPLTSVQNFTEIVAGEPHPTSSGIKRMKGSQIWRWWTCRRLYLVQDTASFNRKSYPWNPMVPLWTLYRVHLIKVLCP